MKQVIVTGGRDYDNSLTVNKVLSIINPDMVIQGGASGADGLALAWAKTNGKEHDTIKADWTKYGKSAGPKRNAAMLRKYPMATVVAFPGDTGTADCVSKAIEYNMIIFRVLE